MNNNTQGTLNIADISGNPAPLGLLGFGMTTVLLNLHNAGFFSLGSMILAMGICYGGIAQIIAGLMEWKKGNTFATTAFISYGFFWLSLVALLVLPKMGLVEPADTLGMVFYLGMWGLFTFFMFIATLKLHKSLQVVFFLLTILFFMLAIGDYLESHSLKVLAGYEGILCGLSAIYAAVAQIINEVYGKTILPV
jgi:succinate-acetate transporter protein